MEESSEGSLTFILSRFLSPDVAAEFFFPQAAVINLTKVMGKDYATLGKAVGKEAFLRKELLLQVLLKEVLTQETIAFGFKGF